MKMKFVYFAVLCVATLFMTGCSSSSNDEPTTPSSDALEVVSSTDMQPSEIIGLLTQYAPSAAPVLEESRASGSYMALINAKMQILGLTSVKSDVVRFKSVGKDGAELYQTGKIYIPQQTSPLRGIIIANHYTITQNSEAPSQTFQLEGAASLLGYAVVMADYIGFGETKAMPQTYLCADLTAHSSVDLALCTYKYLNDMGYKFVYADNEVYNEGYSQGGEVALAVQKLIESEYADKFTIRKTFAGAGPYDIAATFKTMIANNNSPISAVMPLTFIAMNYYYGLNLDFSKYFKEPLLSNYDKWINSKDYNTTQIDGLLGTTKVDAILTANALNPDAAEMKAVNETLEKNSLVKWSPKAPIALFHSTTDNVVPDLNSKEAYEYFKANSSATVTFDNADYGSHYTAALQFYMKYALAIY
jgi:pimeloyl-ACP methyl ester carboxylesterase